MTTFLRMGARLPTLRPVAALPAAFQRTCGLQGLVKEATNGMAHAEKLSNAAASAAARHRMLWAPPVWFLTSVTLPLVRAAVPASVCRLIVSCISKSLLAAAGPSSPPCKVGSEKDDPSGDRP